MASHGGPGDSPNPRNIGDRSSLCNVAINGTLYPARDTVALPALTVTEGASSNISRHRYSSSLGSFPTFWNTASSLFGEPSDRPTLEAAALLRPNCTTPQGHNHRRAKSASSSTSISSQPVIVRTYQGSRASSRTRSPHVNTLPPTMSQNNRLPPAEDFSFGAILRAVEPDIQSAIDAIAEICARSKMSLADEHSAHIPPTGEIRETDAGYRGRQGPRYGYRTVERTLTAVPEASSSSERLAGGSKASSDSGQGKTSAYGSLKNIITGRKSSQSSKIEADTSVNASESTFVTENENALPKKTEQHYHQLQSNCLPSAALISSSTTLNQVSMNSSSAIPVIATPEPTALDTATVPNAHAHARSRSTSSLASWFTWPRSLASASANPQWASGPRAEVCLRNILQSSFANNRHVAGNYG